MEDLKMTRTFKEDLKKTWRNCEKGLKISEELEKDLKMTLKRLEKD